MVNAELKVLLSKHQ